MARVAVQTNNMRYYYKLLNLFKGYPLKTKFFTLDQSIPMSKFDLIITTEDLLEQPSNSQILHIKEDDLESDILLRIFGLIARKQVPKFKQVIVGIDPGERIGVAAVCDGMILAARTSDLKNLTIAINKYLLTFPGEKIIIRIGNRPKSVSRVIFNKLFSFFENHANITLEMVEESFSNPKKPFFNLISDSDETAAINIAQRAGKVQNHTLQADIPMGRIAEIQKWSRNRSRNRITIDAELAKSVALGKITLDEAIVQKEKQIGLKKDD